MSSATVFIDWVPKSLIEQLAWRSEIQKLALRDRKAQRCFREAAFEDVLFFFNAFAWLYEPRAKHKIIPFNTWPHQDPAILIADRAIDDSEQSGEPIDVIWDKSRAQGASYLALFIALRRWLRDPMFAAGLVTRNADTVDSAVNPDALLWKVNWAITRLPSWLCPREWARNITDHTIVNYDIGGTFVGFPATGDVGSGGRKTLFIFDEVAKFKRHEAQAAANSTQHVTNCRFFISTHKGDSGLFYRMVTEDSTARRIVLDWKDNPTQSRLAYRIGAGMAIAERLEDQRAVTHYIHAHKAELGRLERRGFIKENRLRSPWYDMKCLQAGATPRGIAEDLDRDPRGTVGKLFNTQVLDRMRKEKAQPPVWQGKPVIHDGQLRFMRDRNGPLKVWFQLGLEDAPPRGKYVIGADISMGVGSSNSSLIAGNAITGEQVLEYVDGMIPETRLARLAVLLGHWLNEAELIWENTGPTGRRFGTEILKETGYGNVWRAEREDVQSHQKVTRAGWTNNLRSAKADLFEDLWIAWDDDLCTPRSAEMLDECGGWERDDKGRTLYQGTGHGDRAVAMGLCWKAMKDSVQRGVDNKPQTGQDVVYGTLAWRIARDARRPVLDDEGEGFGLRELLGLGQPPGYGFG